MRKVQVERGEKKRKEKKDSEKEKSSKSAGKYSMGFKLLTSRTNRRSFREVQL